MEVSDLNKLMKMHRQMSDMMKKMGKMGKGGMLKQAMKGMMGKGGMDQHWKRQPSRWAAACRDLVAAAWACLRGFPGLVKRSDHLHADISHRPLSG